MKHSLRIALALLVIAALGLGMFAMAEGVVEPETIEGIEGLENEVEIEGEDMGELNLALGDLVSEGPEAPATAVYRFIVNETEYQVQQVRDGEAVLLPENPAAPEGMAFEAWVLESGAPLFVDADGNGEIDPVIANVEAQPEVKVWASFKQVEVQPTEEQPANEQPTEGTPEPSPATEGSDSGEGGAVAPEEVVPPAEPITGEEGEEEPTSSVSPDGEPASHGPAGPVSLETVHRTVSQALDAPEGEALGVPEEQPAADEPTDEQPTEGTPEPSPATEGSDSGEGGAAAPEEVVPPAEPITGEEGEGDPTSSVSPDGEPASPKGEAIEVPEEAPAEEAPADEQPTDAAPIANALTYTGEAQALVSAGEGWLYSLDGEAFTADIPTAVDAGEYTVFFKAAEDTGAQALTVTVAKADVVLIPPEALTEGE